ncbi:MAG: HlyD family efflux transporter periplasmic adaptor subunit [Acidobacteria bacterium]|nr:MAG: HlyD family efflux transporter periplasmic adaptor subunit [Acidobacteriota bacterium]
MKSQIVWLFGVVLILTALGIGIWLFPDADSTSQLVLSGVIEGRMIKVGSRLGGRIAEVDVAEGQWVKAGTRLVRFEAGRLLAERNRAAARVREAAVRLRELQRGSRPEEIEMARAKAEAARQELEKLRAGWRAQEIARARAALAAAEADWRNAQANYERLAQLYENDDISRQTLDEAERRVKVARARVRSAREQLSLLQEGFRAEEVAAAEQRYRAALAYQQLVEAGPRPEAIDRARAQLAQARAELAALDADLAETEVKAPLDCLVDVLDVRPGDLIAPGAPVAILVDPSHLWVRVFIPEPKLGWVHIGQEVTVTVDAYPGRTFRGRIEWISQRAEFTPRNVQTPEERIKQVFAAKVALENEGRWLHIGMPADVHIELASSDTNQ